jgi:hypothetical protein
MANNATTIGGADQDDIAQLFPDQKIRNVLNMSSQADVPAEKMRAFAQTGQRRRKHLVTRGRQLVTNAFQGPTAAPRAVDKNVCRHWSTSLFEFVSRFGVNGHQGRHAKRD